MEEAPTGTSRRSSTLTAGVVAALLLALGVALSIMWGVRDAGDDLTSKALTTNNGDPLISDTQRHEAVAVAEQFCLRMDGVDGSDPDGYVKKVSELLTTKQKTKFTQEFADFQKLGVDKKLKGTGTILASGVSDIDPDSATVLVAHDSSVVAETGTTQRHYRWSVSLRKVDGHWLVDDFTQVS
ncbi:hypothetical protein [Nocardioides marmorisolisilvae]|uniref:Mce-associated membrane protein n=1 Tax=Nocardioides marmorisolisilvae TaxID=1542737 RepID=A0A3N0DZP6_9ACTN|nr:hypothetical protein [Nocardioides marmorisolisilvae]RNL81050.1 hypothetical protein EFL95_01320 [Nocardioides marmorisolisilvae]